MELTPLQEKFVLHWGEMGNRWGVNRTIGQIHALLYLSEHPLNAEEIAETLNVARSNVSTSIKELQSYGLIRTAHVMGDRRDHFEALQDVWQMFKQVVEERRRREIDPTISMLRNALLESPASRHETRTQEKMRRMLDFLETGSTWMDEMHKLSPESLMKLLKMGSKIQRFIRGNAKETAEEKTR